MATSRDDTRGLTAFGDFLTRGFGTGRRRKGEARLPFNRWVRELAWRHVIGLIFVFFALFPIIWIISASFNTVPSLSASRIIPEAMTFENYRSLFNDPDLPFGRWLFNSFARLLRAVDSSGLTVNTERYAASAISRLPSTVL